MTRISLRRLFFDRFVLNLALLLGLTQVLVAGWLWVVVAEREAPGWAATLSVAALLVAGNGLLVPGLRRSRRRQDWVGAATRAYVNAGIATLLIGLAIVASGLLLLLVAGLLGALGASPAGAVEVLRVGSIACVGVVALSILAGFTFGQARIERTRLRVPVPGLSPDLAGLSIVHATDLHIGNHMEGATLTRMVERINALEPDVLVLTGDIFDFDPAGVEDGARRLGDLRARHGVYAMLGNHDTYVGAELVADALARHAPGIRLLRDEIVRLPVPAPLHLAGVEDPGRDWSSRRLELEGLDAVAAARPEDGPTLLLVHRPQAFPQAARLGFPLVLCGHTHGGQLALPWGRGQMNLASVVTGFSRGLYREAGSTLYVNRGLGVGGPKLRIHCSREIATLELVPAEAAA